jgi:hypothetical protein
MAAIEAAMPCTTDIRANVASAVEMALRAAYAVDFPLGMAAAGGPSASPEPVCERCGSPYDHHDRFGECPSSSAVPAAAPALERLREAIATNKPFTALGLLAAVEEEVTGLRNKEQVLYDIHHAMGIEWGDDPYSVIARLAASERALEEMRAELKETQEAKEAAYQMLYNQRARLEQARDALRQYGQHHQDCTERHGPCTCGLDAALSGAAAPKEEKP